MTKNNLTEKFIMHIIMLCCTVLFFHLFLLNLELELNYNLFGIFITSNFI